MFITYDIRVAFGDDATLIIIPKEPNDIKGSVLIYK